MECSAEMASGESCQGVETCLSMKRAVGQAGGSDRNGVLQCNIFRVRIRILDVSWYLGHVLHSMDSASHGRTRVQSPTITGRSHVNTSPTY